MIHIKLIKRDIDKLINGETINHPGVAISIRENTDLENPLIELGLPTRAYNAFSVNIETIGDLLEYTKKDLLKFRNFGPRGLPEIEKIYEKRGYFWPKE